MLCKLSEFRVLPARMQEQQSPKKSFALWLCGEKNELKEISLNIHLTETCKARAGGLDGGEAF